MHFSSMFASQSLGSTVAQTSPYLLAGSALVAVLIGGISSWFGVWVNGKKIDKAAAAAHSGIRI